MHSWAQSQKCRGKKSNKNGNYRHRHVFTCGFVFSRRVVPNFPSCQNLSSVCVLILKPLLKSGVYYTHVCLLICAVRDGEKNNKNTQKNPKNASCRFLSPWSDSTKRVRNQKRGFVFIAAASLIEFGSHARISREPSTPNCSLNLVCAYS